MVSAEQSKLFTASEKVCHFLQLHTFIKALNTYSSVEGGSPEPTVHLYYYCKLLTEAKFHLVIGTVEIDYMQKELIRYQIRNKTLSPLVRMALEIAVRYKNKLDKLVPNNCNNNWT